jgi:hypothetical protein
MPGTLVSIDLDWLNGAESPIDKLQRLLRHIPRKVPAVITIEHHEFLPHLRRWIKSKEVPIPLNIINFDEHHDFYYGRPPLDPNGTETDCGNWGFRLPIKWYRRFTWVHNTNTEFIDWDRAQEWLDKRKIQSSMRNKPRLSELRTEIVAAIFCVSPDYLKIDMFNCICDAIDIVACHFKMGKAPQVIRNGQGVSSVKGWRVASRPQKRK